MLNPAEFFQATLSYGLKASSNSIVLCPGEASALDEVGKGNSTYLVLTDGFRHEVVRYTHSDDYADRVHPDQIAVERDVLARGQRNFAPGACVRHEWFGRYILEWVKQEAEGAQDD